MDRFQYLILMGLCVLMRCPSSSSSGRGCGAARSVSRSALLPAFALFVAWDLWASATGTWGFNRAYTIGVELPGGMAIEEARVLRGRPICALLTIEAVRNILSGRARLRPLPTRIRRRGASR